MTTLNLQNLSAGERDEAVNRAVAETAGWTRDKISSDGLRHGETALWPPNRSRVKWPHGVSAPPYSTSADAVFPLLEKFPEWDARFRAGIFVVVVTANATQWERPKGEASTFPLAACVALLRARGIEVLT